MILMIDECLAQNQQLHRMHRYSPSLMRPPSRPGRGTFRGTTAVSVLGILSVLGSRGDLSVQAERPARRASELLIRRFRNGALAHDLVSGNRRAPVTIFVLRGRTQSTR